MEIAAFGMDDFTKHSLSYKIQNQQLAAVVAAVLHHDAVTFGFFRCLHKLPAFFDGDSRRDLGCSMFSGLHRGDTHRCMPLPWGCGIDKIEIALVAQAFEIGIAARIPFRPFLPGFFHLVLDFQHTVGYDIAHRTDFTALDTQQIPDMGGTHTADSNIADPDRVNFRRGELNRRLSALCLRAFGYAAPAQRRAKSGGSDFQEVSAVEIVTGIIDCFTHLYVLLRM